MNKRKIIFFILIITVVMIIGKTTAVFTSQDLIINKFNIGSIKINIDENGFNNQDNWSGDVTTKHVQIINNEKSDCLVRVAIVPMWRDKDGKQFYGDTSLVKLKFENINEKIEDSSWYDGNDSYYYYIKKLKSNESTKNILDSVKLEGDLPSEYKGKTLVVEVIAEAVQATGYNREYPFEKAWKGINQSLINKLREICDKE